MSGKLTLISSATASGSSSVEFTSGIDSTYDEYVFYFVDINPVDDGAELRVEGSVSGSFGVTKTTTRFYAQHNESGSTSGLHYSTGGDLAQSTSPQMLTNNIGSSSDESCVGELHLFSPSSTSKVKHFYSRFQTAHSLDFSVDTYVAGYWNTTSAIDGIRYTMTSGNFDGQIHMFGVS